MKITRIEGMRQAIAAQKEYTSTLRKIERESGIGFCGLCLLENKQLHLSKGLKGAGLKTKVINFGSWDKQRVGELDGVTVFQILHSARELGDEE